MACCDAKQQLQRLLTISQSVNRRKDNGPRDRRERSYVTAMQTSTRILAEGIEVDGSACPTRFRDMT